MDPPPASITARNQNQAMEWSLVLISQDIESTIVREAPDDDWALQVAPSDYERARKVLAVYRQENRRWMPRWGGPIFHGGAIIWVLFVALFYVIDLAQDRRLSAAGMVDSQAIAAGQWWRLFTAISLHGDLAHLFGNIGSGLIFFGLAMARFGVGVSLLVAFIGGAAGNILGLIVYDRPYRNVGASGMVTACLGLLSIQSLYLWRRSPAAARYLSSGMLGGLLLLVLTAFDPATDVIAHIGGYVAGTLLGAVIARFETSTLTKPGINFACAGLWLLLLAYAWSRALRAS